MSARAPGQVAPVVAETAQADASGAQLGVAESLAAVVLPYIPASVRPNTITLLTHAVGWLTAALAVASAREEGLARSMCLVGASVGMFASVIGDCLDGMHARRTQQCSNLGAMLDHWLDALVVPLVPAGITVALGMLPWQIVVVMITAPMVYHGQLVLYHHTGEFVAPEPATGSGAQLGVSLGFLAMAVLFYFVDPGAPWIRMIVYGIALLGFYIQVRCNWFYYVRLGRLVLRHFLFVAPCAAFGLLQLIGVIDLNAFLLCMIFVSFRVSGSYVLWTLLGRPYSGFDGGAFAWPLLIGGVHVLSGSGASTLDGVAQLLPYLACAYFLARNLIDFSQHFGALNAGRTSA
jgi:phosphatidylglycerophosphate synthase